jgi:hypothetical protein
MKTPAPIMCLLLATTLFAAPEDKREVPAFPSAVISIEGPRGHRSFRRADETIRSAFPLGSVKQMEVTGLEGSEDLSVDDKSAGSISWRHIARTEFGDMYLVFHASPDGKKEAASLLFDGQSEVSWRCGDWRISISKEKPSEPTAPSGRGSP